MNFKYLAITIFSLALMASNLPKNIQKKVDKEVKAAYSVETYELLPMLFNSNTTKSLPIRLEKNNLFKILSDSTTVGYAYVSKAPSKTDEFDYLVLFDAYFIIKKAKILIYREDYGNEIGSKRWLKQLIGKTQNDKLTYGDNIAAISGATISVKSMTNAINNLLKSINILHQKQLL